MTNESAAAEERVPSLDTIVVLAAGPDPAVPVSIPVGALIVAADGGGDYAVRLGLAVDVAIGDFDSISAAGLSALERAGVRIKRYPSMKDATDLELALDLALGLGPRRVLLIGSGSGRADHALGQLLLLAAEAYRDVEMDAQLGRASIHVIRDERCLVGARGELISLFAVHGAAVGVVTEGLVYPLRGETLSPGSSRGVSNVFAGEQARVTVAQGALLAIRPGEGGAAFAT
jgi:thiamine pyrophosphokinase